MGVKVKSHFLLPLPTRRDILHGKPVAHLSLGAWEKNISVSPKNFGKKRNISIDFVSPKSNNEVLLWIPLVF